MPPLHPPPPPPTFPSSPPTILYTHTHTPGRRFTGHMRYISSLTALVKSPYEQTAFFLWSDRARPRTFYTWYYRFTPLATTMRLLPAQLNVVTDNKWSSFFWTLSSDRIGGKHFCGLYTPGAKRGNVGIKTLHSRNIKRTNLPKKCFDRILQRFWVQPLLQNQDKESFSSSKKSWNWTAADSGNHLGCQDSPRLF